MASGTYYCEECHENTTNTEAGSASCNVGEFGGWL